MDILNLLGIEKSIIVLNKCDLVDEEWLEMMEEDVREELSGTFLEHAPLVKVSAATGAGLDDLVKEIEHQTRDEVVQKDIHTIPRLPDRQSIYTFRIWNNHHRNTGVRNDHERRHTSDVSGRKRM